MSDILLRGMIGQSQARFFLSSSKNMIQAAADLHHTSPTATAALGRVMTAASMMGIMLKDEDQTLAVNMDGDGPAGKVIVYARTDGSVKAYISNPLADLPVREDHKLDVGGLIGKNGQLTVTKSMGNGNSYNGSADIKTGEVAEDFAWYFTISEQQPSLVSLGVLIDTDGTVKSAGGLIIQPLPGCSEELLSALELRAPIFADISRHLDAVPDVRELAQQFMGDLDVEITETYTPVFRCDCSRRRTERALISIGAAELDHLISEDEGAQVVCHFCNAQYDFTPQDLKNLLAEATALE